MIQINDLTQIGGTGLYVSRFGLGAAHIPNNGFDVGVQTVQEAVEKGIRFIDTAPLYGGGRSEEIIGAAVAGMPRESYTIATKVGRLVTPERDCYFDFTRDGILRSLDESLERLKIDYVDILHIHDPDDHYQIALDEAFPTLADLRSQGVIKAIGSGMNQWEMLLDFARNADFDCFLLAGRYTLLEQASLDFLAECQAKNISIILGGVYNSGILAGKTEPLDSYNYAQAPQEIMARAKGIAAICREHNVDLNVAALQFVYTHPAVSAVALGAETPEHIRQNVEALAAEIPDDLWTDLMDAGYLKGNHSAA